MHQFFFRIRGEKETINSLTNGKNFRTVRFRRLSDDKIIVAYKLNFDAGGVKNIGKHCGKKNRKCWL